MDYQSFLLSQIPSYFTNLRWRIIPSLQACMLSKAFRELVSARGRSSEIQHGSCVQGEHAHVGWGLPYVLPNIQTHSLGPPYVQELVCKADHLGRRILEVAVTCFASGGILFRTFRKERKGWDRSSMECGRLYMAVVNSLSSHAMISPSCTQCFFVFLKKIYCLLG